VIDGSSRRLSREIATELVMHWAKKIVDMRLVGRILDNLEAGINSFSMVINDNSNQASEITYLVAIKVARN
jgi:hypothetical protein